MESRCSFCLLIILSLLSLKSRANGSGSVVFLDSSSHRYFRPIPSDATSETELMLLSDVGAAVSVLLGFAPPDTLSAASSSRLNDVLAPNPFDRPRSVFMIDVRGAEGVRGMVQSTEAFFGQALRRTVIMSSKADIQLPDEDEVLVISLNEPLSSNLELTDKELNNIAHWLDGTFVADTLQPMNGELTIPLVTGSHLKFHMSKKADRDFIRSLLSLFQNTQRAIDMHKDFSRSKQHPAELIMGAFDAIKFLQGEYGTEGIAQQGLELLFTSIFKIFDSLQDVYKGEIVGVILLNGTPLSDSENALNLMFSHGSAVRLLEETDSSSTSTSNSTAIAELELVRWTLAWTTGIILLIATLLGIYFLLNMPLTKDTLLYANVKLD
ncbi:hypothetical protein NMG60_11017418 [Bertholletia excelsa]